MSRLHGRTRCAALQAVCAFRSVTWRGVRAMHLVQQQWRDEFLTARVICANKTKKTLVLFHRAKLSSCSIELARWRSWTQVTVWGSVRLSGKRIVTEHVGFFKSKRTTRGYPRAYLAAAAQSISLCGASFVMMPPAADFGDDASSQSQVRLGGWCVGVLF